jgi:hypothetical protein
MKKYLKNQLAMKNAVIKQIELKLTKAKNQEKEIKKHV